MDPNSSPRLRTQATESYWFLLFACVTLLVPPMLAAVVAKRPVTPAPAADVSSIDAAAPDNVAQQTPPPAHHPIAGASAHPAVEG